MEQASLLPLAFDRLTARLESGGFSKSVILETVTLFQARTAMQGYRPGRSEHLPRRLSNFHSDTVVTAGSAFESNHARHGMGVERREGRHSGNNVRAHTGQGRFRGVVITFVPAQAFCFPCLSHTTNIAGARNGRLVSRHSQVASNP